MKGVVKYIDVRRKAIMREINRTNENFIFGYNYNDQDCVIFVFQGFGYIVEMWSVQVRVLKASVWYRLYHSKSIKVIRHRYFIM